MKININKEISIISEKKLKKISTITLIIIITLTSLITIDIYLVTKKNIGPILAIKTKTYNDGGSREYYGLGYKVIKYNQKIGRKDTVVGPYTLKYNTTPISLTQDELIYSIINDNNNYIGEFIRLKATITKKDYKNNTLIIKNQDNTNKKYNITIKAKLKSKNIKDLNKEIYLIGVVKSYNNKNKQLIIENVYVK